MPNGDEQNPTPTPSPTTTGLDFSNIPGHTANGMSTPPDHPLWQRLKDAFEMPQDAYTQKYAADDAATHAKINHALSAVIPFFKETTEIQPQIEKTALGKQAGEFVQSQLEHPEEVAMAGGEEMFPEGINVGPLKTLKFDVIPGHKVESARAGKITASEERLAGNQPWQQQQVESEIERLEGILRNPRATEEERNIATSQLQNYRETSGQPAESGKLGTVTPAEKRFVLGPVKPKSITGTEESEEGYVYHGTNKERALDIAETGNLETHRPLEHTDQEMWPDGKTEKRSYFTKNAGTAYQFTPEGGDPVLLRMKQDPTVHKTESTGDLYSTKKIPSDRLEILDESGLWRPLEQLKISEESGARAGKITESAGRLSERPEWQKQQVDTEIQRLEGVLRNPQATPEERHIATDQLKDYRGESPASGQPASTQKVVEDAGGTYRGENKAGLVEITLPREMTNAIPGLQDRFRDFVSITMPKSEINADSVKDAMDRKFLEMGGSRKAQTKQKASSTIPKP